MVMVLTRRTSPRLASHCRVVVVGEENVGKTQLVSSLTRKPPHAENFAGSTVSCDVYSGGDIDFVDTPGMLLQSDTETTRLAVQQVRQSDLLLVVIKATHFDRSFQLLRPLMTGKRVVIVLTFADKISGQAGLDDLLASFKSDCGIEAFAVDSRKIDEGQRSKVLAALRNAPVAGVVGQVSKGLQAESATQQRSWVERLLFSAPAAAISLFLPAVLAVTVANHIAGILDPPVEAFVQPTVDAMASAPVLIKDVLVGRYGLITMGPLMFVWALPTVILYALILGAYKASGLLDRLTQSIHPLTRPFGLSGRDVVRVLMGFGCNVPAVISTRACSGCSRNTCVSAIAFGSACSYQLGATLAVFAATHNEFLVAPYMIYLLVTTLIFVRVISPPIARSAKNELLLANDTYLQFPTLDAVWRECRMTIVHFLRRAMPIFLCITVLASIMDWAGLIETIGHGLKPVMAIFGLPSDTVIPVLMASIRKDGILLFAQPDLAKVLSSGQLFVGTYLAGVLLPCLVTALTVIQERSLRFAAILMARQAVAALAFSIALVWVIRLTGF